MPYDKSAGFLNDFTSSEKNAIKTVRQKQILDRQEYTEDDADNFHIFYYYTHDYASIAPIENALQNYDTAYCEYSDDRVFLLDIKQAYDLYMDFGEYLAAEPTKAAVKDVKANSGLSMAYVHEWSYWLRTPSNFGRSGDGLRTIRQRTDTTRSLNTFSTFDSMSNDGSYGVRPAFYLDQSSSDITYGSGTASDPYGINRTKPITPTTTVTTTETTTHTTTETTTETTTAQTTTTTETTTETTTTSSSDSDKTSFVFGDADGSNTITLNDAILVLRKTLSASELPIQSKTDDWLKYIDV
ncbi:MAG: hypothetical protein IJ736_13495, partial [Firmicutes bacterium]|nr:hypothetical protein [Bacillota bacterium]